MFTNERKLLISYLILLVCTLGNVLKTVWRIFILMLGWEGVNKKKSKGNYEFQQNPDSTVNFSFRFFPSFVSFHHILVYNLHFKLFWSPNNH